MEKIGFRERLAREVGAGATKAGTLMPTCALEKPCSRCQRTGYHLTTEGPFVTAELCGCVLQCANCFGTTMRSQGSKGTSSCREPNPRRIVSLFGDAQIPARYKEVSFDKFNNLTGNGPQVLTKIKRWLREFDPVGGPGLILGGAVGVGKTYLLAAIGKHLCAQGMGVKFIDFHRLLAVIRAGYAERRSEEDVLAPLIQADVLIIDEFGKSQGKDWEIEKLDQIVMGRYNQNRVIIASTNYGLTSKPETKQFFNTPLDQKRSSFNPDEFESLESRVGQRIFSRLVETSVMLTLEGQDYRRRLAPSRVFDEGPA